MSDHDDMFGPATLRQLHDVVSRMNTLESLEDTLQAVVDGVVDAVGFGVAAVSTFHTAETLETVAVAGDAHARAEVLGSRFPLTDLTREFDVALEWGRLRFVPHENLPEDPFPGWVPDIEIADADDAWHPLDALYAPLHNAQGTLVGVLSVDLPDDRRRPGPMQRDLLETFASHAGIAINNAQVATRLKVSESTFRLAFNSAGVGIAVIDIGTDGNLLHVNPTLCEMLGRSADKLLGLSVFEVMHADDRPGSRLAFSRIRSGEESAYITQRRLTRADGISLWSTIHVTAITDDTGEPVSAMAIIEDIGERRDREIRLAHEADHDELTGLPNRRVLYRRLAEAIDTAHQDRTPGVLLFGDLDGFKEVNDVHGHAIGDRVLAVVANRIENAIRLGDVAVRVGGDEIVVIADRLTAVQGRRLIRRLSDTVSTPIRFDGAEVRVRLSIGMTEIPADDHTDVDRLLREADDAMYESKQQRGRR